MILRIGTRGSRLALAQAEDVASRLRATGNGGELVPIETSGDRGVPADASPQGLKGLFVTEIVRALIDGDVDLAVHSAKDLPAENTEGVVLAAVPPRESALDLLVSRDGAVAPGSVVGTSAVRRRAQLAASRPELTVRELRGNVDTRLAKLEAGEVDALVLAEAGLARLGITPAHATRLALEEMVPAPGQGALAIQCRAGDERARAAIDLLDDVPSRTALEAERALMLRLGGGCALPLGGYAIVRRRDVHLTGLVASPDGARIARAEALAPSPHDAAARVADDLLAQGAGEILAAVREG
ncbi:MAG: hydroxymethylbilane synthase [Actinomycetota bacterium]